MRDAAHANGGDVSKKVAWAKQVLKFIERHQVRSFSYLISPHREQKRRNTHTALLGAF